MNFPFVDFTIAVIAIIAVIVGIKRGFWGGLLKLISFALSVFFAYMLTGGILKVAGNWFGLKIGATAILETIFRLVIIVVLFAIFEVIFSFIERRIRKAKPNIGPKAVDKLLGFSVGLVKAGLIVIVGLSLIVFMFPGENAVTAEIRVSIVGRFLFEKNPLAAFLELYLL